jgi:hypothetical protein
MRGIVEKFSCGLLYQPLCDALNYDLSSISPNFNCNMVWQYLPLIPTTIIHLFLSWREKKTLTPPGELIDLGGYRIHIWVQGKERIQNEPSRKVTIVLDHSLGGIEGYLLSERLAELGQVCIYVSSWIWMERSHNMLHSS